MHLQKAVQASEDFPGKDEARKRLAVLGTAGRIGVPLFGPNWRTICVRPPTTPWP